MNILITGGAGFIGSHVVRHFVTNHKNYNIYNVDSLTYAGNLSNLKDIENLPNYKFIKADIRNYELMSHIMKEFQIDAVIHLAAESHVDNSIKDPFTFAETNIIGTLSLLNAAKEYWKETPTGYRKKLFYHVSTDEVYGSLSITKPDGVYINGIHTYGDTMFTEDMPYKPHSPYSASKASSDHFVRAYHDTYGLPCVISNCSNNYGPYQYPEKLIPLFLKNIMERKPLPVYGDGKNVRDWLFVEDHVNAIDTIFHYMYYGGGSCETFNIGGNNEMRNIDMVKILINTADRLLGRKEGEDMNLIKYVEDRKGHDERYAIDATKLKDRLEWTPSTKFEDGIEKTIRWYINNKEWLYGISS